MNKHILIIDDDIKLIGLLTEYLEGNQFKVSHLLDGLNAVDEIFNKTPDLIILDYMMPEKDGLEVLRDIRSRHDLPVIMLTARGEEYDKLFGFELGVDDYMVKPFSPKELLARIKAIVRRNANAAQRDSGAESISFDGLKIEFNSRNVYVDGALVSLTPKNYELLNYFIDHPNRVFSREQLLNAVWGYDFYGEDRTVDTHIKMLRESLGDYRKFIVTVWGTGYKFETGEKR
jgi:DNA-binding response OmpR family regulator